MAAALTALSLGAWLGTALQLQQRALDGSGLYAAALAVAVTLALLTAWWARRAVSGWLLALALAWLLAGALLAWGAARLLAPREAAVA